MNLTQVSKYMPDGLRALRNLCNMLLEAARACKIFPRKSAGWEYIGVTLDGGNYWLGINFAEPEKLQFRTWSRIDPEAADRLGVGELLESTESPGGYYWSHSVELDSEDVYFFARTKVSQMQWLEEFLRDCLKKARSIETPDQPPIPEEPEGN